MTYNIEIMNRVVLFLLVCFLLSTVFSNEVPSTDRESKPKVSVLILTGIYISHQFPLLALGEELVSRGHRVAIVGPLIEGSNVLSNLSQDVGVEFINAGFISRAVLQTYTTMSNNTDVFRFVSQLNKAEKEEAKTIVNFVGMIKDSVDQLNSQDWDYIVAENSVIAIAYYLMQKWHTEAFMLHITPLMGGGFGVSQPWPSPGSLTALDENMSFKDRITNTILELMFSAFKPFINQLAEGGAVNLGIDYFGNMGLTHPVLVNTVLGFDFPKVTLPLVHYTGPLLLKSYPPLDTELLDWLEEKERRSVVYISMGSMFELTVELGRSILNGIPSNYSIVWSLRESNRNILEGLKINKKRIFIAGWVSQVTFLQHKTVAMAILHCGIGGVQESLCNKVPVICIPYALDQFGIAVRVDGRFGVRLLPSEVTQESMSDAVSKISSGRFQDKVNKMSVILRQGGGAKKAADLVEFYSEVGHQHGIPAFVKYKWSWIQYYNVDVWGMLIAIAGLAVGMSVKCFKYCFRKCCRKMPAKKKKD